MTFAQDSRIDSLITDLFCVAIVFTMCAVRCFLPIRAYFVYSSRDWGVAFSANQRICCVVLSDLDRNLLERCLAREPKAWGDFVDRFMGLIVHVVNHAAQAKSVRLSDDDRDDLCAEILLNVIKDDFAILRHFRGQSSLATYLTVIARRVAVKQILKRNNISTLGPDYSNQFAERAAESNVELEERISSHEEVEKLLGGLRENEAQVVRLYHLEGKSYKEISEAVGISENSIGPILSRAREKMRRSGVN